jgi:hypothetical protein
MAAKKTKKTKAVEPEKAPRVQLILDPELLEKLRDDAWRARKSMSEYLRDLIRKG